MACDLRIARTGAGRLGLPEVNLGVLPGTGGTQRFARLVGKPKAIELMATGDLFDFDYGESLGLLNRQIEADSAEAFMEAVIEYARDSPRRTRRRRPSDTSSGRCRPVSRSPSSSRLAVERELQQQLFQSADAREGLDAYVEKRKPEFEGR